MSESERGRPEPSESADGPSGRRRPERVPERVVPERERVDRERPDRAAVAVLCLLAGGVLLWSMLDTPWNPLGPGAPYVPADPGADFSAAELVRAKNYRAAMNPPVYLSWGISIAVVVWLGLTSHGAGLVGALGRLVRLESRGGSDRHRLLRAGLGGFGLVVLVRLLVLPFDAWAESVRQAYGLSTRSWAGWLSDTGIGFLVTAAVTVTLLVGVVALAGRWPRRWWVPAAPLAAGLVLVGVYAWPLLVEPMFNRFTPMPDGELRTALLASADDFGVPIDEVLVADASRRQSTLNAYVSGIGSSRRVVVYDTLLAEATDAEVRSVVAHELAHVAHGDVPRGAVIGALGLGAGTVGLALLLRSPRLRARAGITSGADPRAVALVLALVTIAGFVAEPAQNLISRRVETSADVAALDRTEDPATFADVQRRLAVTNLSDPSPATLPYLWFASHPTTPERIAVARAWSLLRGAEPVPPLRP